METQLPPNISHGALCADGLALQLFSQGLYLTSKVLLFSLTQHLERHWAHNWCSVDLSIHESVEAAQTEVVSHREACARRRFQTLLSLPQFIDIVIGDLQKPELAGHRL